MNIPYVIEIAIWQAASVEDWKRVARLGHAFWKRHSGNASGYIHEITARLKLGQDGTALKVLKIAEHEFELQPGVLDKIYEAYDRERPPPLGEADATVHEEGQHS